jgi:hypothetical protein
MGDLTNEVHSKLRVISVASKKGTQTFWNCICECGNPAVVRGSYLTSGHTKSCGCLRSEVADARNKGRRNPDPWVPEMKTYIYHLSVDREHRRVLAETWDLTLDEYKSLVTSSCYYCGAEPHGLPHAKHLRKSGVRRSGIDRIENSKGYTLNNCVTCCGACNREKGALTLKEFIDLTKRRYLHLQSKGLI